MSVSDTAALCQEQANSIARSELDLLRQRNAELEAKLEIDRKKIDKLEAELEAEREEKRISASEEIDKVKKKNADLFENFDLKRKVANFRKKQELKNTTPDGQMPAQERYVGIWGMWMNEVIVKDKEFTECGKCPQCDERIRTVRVKEIIKKKLGNGTKALFSF
ncbi:unnamed protein product [Rhizophagus irregularis]|nr:unnamed protein product [Rhizophagus irregularis]